MTISKTLLSTVFAFLLSFAASADDLKWELYSSEEGVEFYMANVELSGGRMKTLLKIKNGNEVESKVSFYAVFYCTESQARKQSEALFVGAGETAIYTYQICKERLEKGLELKSISVVKQ